MSLSGAQAQALTQCRDREAGARRRPRRTSLRQPGLPETLIVSLYESAVFRVVGLTALLDRGERKIGRADLLAGSHGRTGFGLPTEERQGGCLQCEGPGGLRIRCH